MSAPEPVPGPVPDPVPGRNPVVLHVTGGVGGVDVLLEDLARAGADLLAVAERAAARVRVAALACGRPPLLATAVLDPAGALDAEAALVEAAASLGAGAAGVEAVALAVLGGSGAYRAADAATAAAWHGVRSGAVVALGAVALPVVAVGVVTGLQVAAADGVLAGARALPGRGWAGAGAVGTQRARTRAVALGGGAWAVVVAALPVRARDDVVGAVVGAVPGSTPVAARAVVSLGGPLLAWREGPVRVASGGAPAATRPAAGTAELLTRPPPLAPAARGAEGVVRVERIPAAGGRPGRAVLYLPATQAGLRRTANPMDVESDVRSVGQQRTAATAAAVAALRAAGVGRREPLLVAGFSQGGLTATSLVADPAFRAEFSPRVVLTAGSPAAGAQVPEDVAVLSLEHDGDQFVDMDDGANPAGAHWTTVVADPEGRTPHSAPSYAVTGALVDASSDPSITAWRGAAAPFLAAEGEAGASTTTTWVATRAPLAAPRSGAPRSGAPRSGRRAPPVSRPCGRGRR